MKTIKLGTILAGAGLVALGCSGKLLLDKSTGSSEDGNGGADAGTPPNGEGGGGSGGTGNDVTGGSGGNRNDGTGGRVTGGSGGTLTTGGSPALGMGGTFYPECPDGFPSIGAGGQSPTSLPATKSQWKGNPADCPDAPPELASDCSAMDGEVCVYEQNTLGDASSSRVGWYTCVAKDATHNYWVAPDSGFGHNASGCPTAQPSEGADCSVETTDALGPCHYPHAACYCELPNQTGVAGAAGATNTPEASSPVSWHCIDMAAPETPVPLPAGIDATKRVSDMTDGERQKWCEWYDCNVVYSRYQPVVEGDHTVDPGCASDTAPYANGTWAQLPLPLCMGNLGVSTCEATVRDLTDCLSTFRHTWPVGAGCARYFATPGCSGTIAVADDENYKGGRGGASGSGPGAILDCSVRIK